jgi:hypothetical protein
VLAPGIVFRSVALKAGYFFRARVPHAWTHNSDFEFFGEELVIFSPRIATGLPVIK